MEISRKQKVAKAKFWQRVKKNPALVPDDMDDADVARVAGYLDLQLALKKAEFREWFMDTSINEAMLEVGVDAAIRRLIDICEMSGTDLIGKEAEAKTSDQVRAAEILLRYAGYGPAKATTTPDLVGKDIANMNEQELNTFITTKAKKLIKST